VCTEYSGAFSNIYGYQVYRVLRVHRNTFRCEVSTFMQHQEIRALKYIGLTGRAKCTELQSVHSGAFSKVYGILWIHGAQGA
jgi:hypothetical protein